MTERLFIKNRHGLKMAIRVSVSRENNKLVFLEHGLSARKEYPHMLVMEEEFVKHGYNVVNFDATNSLNESESSKAGITVSGHYEDLVDVIEWAKTQPFYKEPFSLAGQSLGALSIVRYAGEFPKQVEMLIACSFPYINGQIKLKNDPIASKIIENGYYDKLSKSTGRILKMTTAWVEDLKKLDLMPYIKKISAFTYVIIGSNDSETHLDNSKILFNSLNCGKDFVLLDGVPHDLANNERDKKLFTETIDNILTNQNHATKNAKTLDNTHKN